MSQSLKCAIIGYGYMGEIRHRMIEAHPQLHLEWICEIEPGKAPQAEGLTITTDSAEVIENSDVSAVFVCTPNHLIPTFAIQSLDRGKHVFCEKPPGRTINDILSIREAEARNVGVKLMFGFNHRYHPGIMRAKAIVESGQLGRILVLRGLYGKSGGKDFPVSWRNDVLISGGGILLDQGIHMLDLFNFFLGDFTSVKSFLTTKHWGFAVEDNAVVILKNDQEQLAMLHSSTTFWKHMFQLAVILERGYLTVDGLLSKTGSYGRETLIIGRRQFEDQSEALGNPSEEIIYFDQDRSWELEVGKFADAIFNDSSVTESTSLDALNVMNLVDRCYQESNLPAYERGNS